MKYRYGWGTQKMKVLGWVSGLLALLSGVSCAGGRMCDASLKMNPLTVHESDITLSQPATTVDARFCLDTTCRSTSFDATKAFKKACIEGDLGSSRAFCLMPVAPDTVRIGGSPLIGEGPPPPSSLQLTITDTETGTTLFDKKSIPATNGYYVSLFLVDARS